MMCGTTNTSFTRRRPKPSKERSGTSLKGVLLLLVVALGLETVYGAFGDPFLPVCAFIDPPPESWLRWSNASTWPTGRVPGVNPSSAESVLIPCGQAVLLDVPSLNLGLLNVSGHLKFLDDPSLPFISVNATAIVVFGQLTIGTEVQFFSQRVNITLFANGTREQSITSPLPATLNSPQSLGEKVFAVVGGQVNFHGMPGGSQTPSWVHLFATARVNASTIQVDADVSSWPVGGQVAIASTDYRMEQAETVVISNVTAAANGSNNISFSPPLRYMHWGDDMESGVPGVKLFQKAEVALLTRNVVIQGQRESGSRSLIGGHFMVYSTSTPQYIEGVEFAFMGQQGRLGRYPVHFHICRSHNSSYVRKLTVRNSMQRCVVLHATDDLLVEDNVAFNVTGHCYMTEDGVEVNNTFLHNFGAVDYKASILIPPDGNDPNNTDDQPALFWLANANNTLVGNAAGGSQSAGFWYQLELKVRGVSKNLPGADSVIPRVIPIKLFENNSVHSTTVGVTTYERGFDPQAITHPAVGVSITTPVPTWMSGINAYKNYYGLFLHNSYWIAVRNAMLSDQEYGVQATGFNLQILNSVIVAESQNLGNPSQCDVGWDSVDCFPLDTCTLPINATVNGTFRARSVPSPGEIGRRRVVGLLFKENPNPLPPLQRGPVLVSGVTFVGFSPRCQVDFAVFSTNADFKPGFSFDPGHTVERITLINCSRPIYFNPAETWNATANAPTLYEYNEAGWNHVIKDADGSIVGPSPLSLNFTTSPVVASAFGTVTATVIAQRSTYADGVNDGLVNGSTPDRWGVGFVVSNSSHLLPLQNDTRAVCTGEPEWNAYRCWGVCYRTLRVFYPEPGFNGKDTSVRSMLRVTRAADGVTLTLRGTNTQQNGDTMLRAGTFWRAFAANVVVGPEYTYTIEKIGGPKPTADPSWIYFGFEDDSANCGLASKVRLLTKSSSTVYKAERNENVWPFYKYCELPTDPVQRTFVSNFCDARNNSIFEANLGVLGPLNAMPLINATLQAAKPGVCAQNATCGLVALGDTWQYVDAATSAPFPEGILTLNGSFSGRTPFASGYLQVNDVHYKVNPHDDILGSTVTATQPQTLYLWTTFTVTNASCYRNLALGIKAKDGFAVYLNGVSVIEQGLMYNETGLQYSTQGSYIKNPYWQQFPVGESSTPLSNATGLVSGTNTVAVEVHQSAPGTPADQIYFDFWLAAANTCNMI